MSSELPITCQPIKGESKHPIEKETTDQSNCLIIKNQSPVFELIEEVYNSMISNTLTNLTLWSKDLLDEGAEIIAKGIKQCKSLVNINLGYCKIRTRGIIALADALENNKRIENLILGYNFPVILHHSLREPPNEEVPESRAHIFNMANYIQGEGAIAIAKVIRTCPNLRTIALSYCHTTDSKDQEIILKAISSSSIKEAYIWGYDKALTEEILSSNTNNLISYTK